MADPAAAGVLDRCVGVVETAPVAFSQLLYRMILGRVERGRRSTSYQADLTGWLRQAQRGECTPGDACEIFSLSAGGWCLVAASGVMLGMLLDFLFKVPFDVVLSISLSVPPAFALLSGVEAVRARSARDAGGNLRRSKKRRKRRNYRPMARRWIVAAAGSMFLLIFWVQILFVG
ncbi:hypothetical protein GL263_20330 [Streptomyces durbertensis]|uniref:Uncharacterized protein n=1 Tax=Streptomyces durbertensis TaxID=2448886 RepID=A0ABR6EMZ8_9ACTN|nr:hypothetical protein [Streptomyces durbertensis]MBB1245879.1 hypothetical protein [Streptomyces durbertensis]